MIPYILVFVVLLILAFRFDSKHKKNDLKWQYFAIIILILLAGLRNRVGIDTCRYENYFLSVPTYEHLTASDILKNQSQLLWYLLNVLCKSLFGTFVALQLVVASLFHFLLMRFINKTTPYYFTTLLFVYLICWGNLNFETIRESLCVVIFLNAILCLKDKKGYLKYFLFCLPALLIHWFSIIMIALAPIVIMVKRRILVGALLVISIVLFVFSERISEWTLYLALAFSDEASMRISDYIYNDHYGVINVSLLGFLFIMITRMIYPYIVSILYKDIEPIFATLLLLFIPIMILRTQILIFFRLANYLNIILVVSSVNLFFSKYGYNSGYSPLLKKMVTFFLLFVSVLEVKNLYFTPAPVEYSDSFLYDRRYVPYTSVFEEPNKERESLMKSWLGPNY